MLRSQTLAVAIAFLAATGCQILAGIGDYKAGPGSGGAGGIGSQGGAGNPGTGGSGASGGSVGAGGDDCTGGPSDPVIGNWMQPDNGADGGKIVDTTLVFGSIYAVGESLGQFDFAGGPDGAGPSWVAKINPANGDVEELAALVPVAPGPGVAVNVSVVTRLGNNILIGGDHNAPFTVGSMPIEGPASNSNGLFLAILDSGTLALKSSKVVSLPNALPSFVRAADGDENGAAVAFELGLEVDHTFTICGGDAMLTASDSLMIASFDAFGNCMLQQTFDEKPPRRAKDIALTGDKIIVVGCTGESTGSAEPFIQPLDRGDLTVETPASVPMGDVCVTDIAIRDDGAIAVAGEMSNTTVSYPNGTSVSVPAQDIAAFTIFNDHVQVFEDAQNKKSVTALAGPPTMGGIAFSPHGELLTTFKCIDTGGIVVRGARMLTGTATTDGDLCVVRSTGQAASGTRWSNQNTQTPRGIEPFCNGVVVSGDTGGEFSVSPLTLMTTRSPFLVRIDP